MYSCEAKNRISGINGTWEAPDHSHTSQKKSLNDADSTLNNLFGA